MNIIFAIGAKYSHLIEAEWRGDQRDHLLYMTRAVHLLGLKDTIKVVSGPDMELVRAVWVHVVTSNSVLFQVLTNRSTDRCTLVLLPYYRACE